MSSASEETRSRSTSATSGETRGPGRPAEEVCAKCASTDDRKKRHPRCHYLLQCRKHTAASRLRKTNGSKTSASLTRKALTEKCAQQQQQIGALQTEIERLKALLRRSPAPEQEQLHASVTASAFPSLEIAFPVTMASASGAGAAETSHSSVYAAPAGNFGPAHSAFAVASSGAEVIVQAPSLDPYDRRIVQEARDLEEANRQSRYTTVAVQQSLYSSRLAGPTVGIRHVVTVDEFFQGAYYTGNMFRILESFHHFALYLIENMNCGYRYLHPENAVLSPALLRNTPYYSNLPNNECTAYYSKLSRTFTVRNTDNSQFHPLPVPSCYAHYAAPEVLSGHAVDLRKATAFSFGVMLYDALTKMPGMRIDHVVTRCDCGDNYWCRLYPPEFERQHHFIRESTHIRRVDGHFSTGLFSVNPAIISVMKGLLRSDPQQRFPLERFAQLFARTSNYQFDTTLTGAKALDTNLPVTYACSLR